MKSNAVFSSKSDELFDYGDRLKGNKTYNRALSYILYLFYNCTETNALWHNSLILIGFTVVCLAITFIVDVIKMNKAKVEK